MSIPFVNPWIVAHQPPLSMGFSRQEYWSGCHFLQRIFLTQGLNWGLPWCRQILYHLSHQGSLRSMSVQFSSVTQSCPSLCKPVDCGTPGLSVYHQLPESTQSHVFWVCDAIQPCHPLSSPFPPVFNLFQDQGLFQWVSSSQKVAKVLEPQL